MATIRPTIFLIFTGLAFVSSAGLFETLLSWDLSDTEARSTQTQSKCLCQTSGCLCCVDLNLTVTMDLGGPVCVNIRHKEENVSLNLSYGDNPVHNATIKIVEAANKPTCMNLLSDLAQICAKFTSIKTAEHGHDGCLVIEPALLGSPQATYHMGCFNFDQTVRQIELSAITETNENATDSTDNGVVVEEEEEEEEEDGINTDELIAAVSASAEHGLALFSQWLGLNFNPRLNQTDKNQMQEEQPQQHQQQQQQQQQRQIESSDLQTRTARNMMDVRSDKSDERFKQLLSAQDNVLKESAKIGLPNGAETTFVYSSPIGLPALEKPVLTEKKIEIDGIDDAYQRLTVVPKESRRGGRAYSIHQHVNEI